MKWPAGIYRMIIQAVWGTFFYAPLFLFSQGQSTSSAFNLAEPLRSAYPLNKYVSWYAEDAELSIREVQKTSFQPISSLPDKLDPNTAYWVKLDIVSDLTYPSKWKLQSAVIGLADFYFLHQDGQLVSKKSGFYRPKKDKPESEFHQTSVDLHLEALDSLSLYIRLSELDGSSPEINLKLYEQATWYRAMPENQEMVSIFFLGIFFIMFLYNLILFFTISQKAYLYYSLYLLCVAVLVLYTVGPYQTPPFGDPILHMQLPFLAFGALNVCYFLFGRAFLNTQKILPVWDKWIIRYLILKAVLILFIQLGIFLTFQLRIFGAIEFGMLLVDLLIVLMITPALLGRKRVTVNYFLAGSAAVFVIGLPLAVIGNFFSLSYPYYLFFTSLVVEIIFFSLGLGSRLRRTEKEKFIAEQEKRQAQEALNEELTKVNAAFGRFVPHEFIKALGHDQISEVKLGDQVEKEVTVFFSDIRSYTSISEEMTPRENFNFLNSYFGRVGPLIKKHHGFVNQYYGDGIMSLFLQQPEDAISAAIAIHIALRKYNKERKAKRRTTIKIGIGVHCGPLMLGVIGDVLRMEANVVADTVNIASRMEGLTKYYGASIITSAPTLMRIQNPDKFHYRYLGKVQVKGRKEPIGVYDFFDGDKPAIIQRKLDSLDAFKEGMEAYYEKSFVQSARLFDQVLAVFPQDKAAQWYKENSTRHILEGVPDSWDGVIMMTNK